MNQRITIVCALLMLPVGSPDALLAGGFRGGGGGRPGGGGGHSFGGGGGGRPASMPHLGGGGGGARPSMPSARPSMPSSRPSMPSARPSMPSSRPSLPSTRPSQPNFGGGTSGGLKPATRPGQLPDKRPSLPSKPDRPSTLPGKHPSFPSMGDHGFGGGSGRPNTLPGHVDRPTKGELGDFLGLDGGVRPKPLPGLKPGDSGDRPNRPGDRPDTLPGTRPDRPGDRPSRPDDRPGLRPDRPDGRPGDRPGPRPGLRPGDLTPGTAGRPGWNNRPIDVGNIHVGNNVINNRPTWVNIDRNNVISIENRWTKQIGGLHGWAGNRPGRIDYWHGWGNGVRTRWDGYHHHHNWFAGNWWNGHPNGLCHWHYYHRFNDYPWRYWWGRPTWGVAAGWFTWTAPAEVWSQPIYYDYGTGGNVTYEDNRVYIDGEDVASADEFAQSAAVLATAQPPQTDAAADEADWLPLGTFALSTSKSDVKPTRVVQLAVDKTGIISGTLYNTQTDESAAIQGRVDKSTQRVAMRIGESDKIVAETGLYNLTQDEVPLLVHFETDRVENYVLVRLDQPEDDDSGDDARDSGSADDSKADDDKRSLGKGAF